MQQQVQETTSGPYWLKTPHIPTSKSKRKDRVHARRFVMKTVIMMHLLFRSVVATMAFAAASSSSSSSSSSLTAGGDFNGRRTTGMRALTSSSSMCFPNNRSSSFTASTYTIRGGGEGGVASSSSERSSMILAQRRERIHPLLSSSSSSSSETDQVVKKKDYRKEASGIFGSIRIPASLFAGAAASSAFVLPIIGNESLTIGLAKRLYYLLMIGSLSNEIITVVIATLTGMELTVAGASADDNIGDYFKTTSIRELLYDKKYFFLESIAVRYHFWSGILMFLAALGVRAWISISCPVIAKAASGTVLSAILFCLAFFQKNLISTSKSQGGRSGSDVSSLGVQNAFLIPYEYAKALWSESKTSPIFAVALTMAMITQFYILWKIPHVAHYIFTNQLQ